MTPVAKWFKVNKDNTYQTGNGWLQNGFGTWTYDQKSQAFLSKETLGAGIEDEAGAFTVRFKEEEMLWEREEEGMSVLVTLHKITQLPLSPADQLVGLWDLAKVTKDGQQVTSTFDPENKYYLFIRWDRVFLERSPKNEHNYGLWHINGHKPEITFIRKDMNRADEVWHITIDGTELSMRGISETNKDKEMVFNRIHKFPE
jgi:hypothetical protein